MTAPTVRAYLGDGSGFPTAKAAASYVGITPSNWSSGTVPQPTRAISKEGPAALRLAFYQAANAARRHRSAAGRVLPPADDRAGALPHPGHRRRRPQAGRTDLDRARPRTATTSCATSTADRSPNTRPRC